MEFRSALFLISLFMIRCWSLHFSPLSMFDMTSICDVDQRITEGCSREESKTPLLRCLDECGKHTSCIGASFITHERKCFIHDDCPAIPVCSKPSPNHEFYARKCVYGVWNVTTLSCDCEFHTFGDRCEKVHEKCSDLPLAGYPGGSYRLLVDPNQDGNLHIIHCATLDNGYSAIGVLINKGGLNFNRTWRQYEDGFEDDDEYWIGLKTWHVLSTISGYDTMVFVLLFSNSALEYRYHTNFVVGDEASDYSFSFVYSDTNYLKGSPSDFRVGNCMGVVEHVSFSTWDKDNDENSTINCASHVGNGWWHPKDCNNPCNFLSWAIDDWANTPSHQRLSFDMPKFKTIASNVDSLSIYLD